MPRFAASHRLWHRLRSGRSAQPAASGRLIGKTISALECVLRRIFPKTPRGERAAGAVLWGIVAFLAAAVPALLLGLCGRVSPWLRLAVESVMCWQILAAKSLRDESMKVYHELEHGSIESARRAVR